LLEEKKQNKINIMWAKLIPGVELFQENETKEQLHN